MTGDGYPCQECGYVWDSTQAASECAILDAAEARQTHRAHTKRKRWDDGIIRSVD